MSGLPLGVLDSNVDLRVLQKTSEIGGLVQTLFRCLFGVACCQVAATNFLLDLQKHCLFMPPGDRRHQGRLAFPVPRVDVNVRSIEEHIQYRLAAWIPLAPAPCV